MDNNSDGSSDSLRLDQLGKFIRERRFALSLNQTQLGERLGWVQERISLLENGKYGTPSIPALSRLASALESSLFELLHAAGYADLSTESLGTATGSRPGDHALLYTLQRLLAIETLSLRESLDHVSNLLAEVMAADKIDAMLHDSATDSLVAIGSSNTPMGRHQFAIGMDRMPVANGGREVEVFQTGNPYWSPRAKEDPGMLLGVTEGLGVQSLLVVPLDVSGSRRGVLIVECAREDAYVADDLLFLSTVARWVGMIAHHAELVEHIAAEAAEAARRVAAEELMAVLSQDVNYHLSIVKGNIDSLSHKAQVEGRQDYLDCVADARVALTDLNELITELHSATDGQHDSVELSTAPVDLVQLIQDITATHRDSGKPIDLRLPDHLVIQADAARVRQVLENLISHAILHSPDDVAVSVTMRSEARTHGQWAIIEVQDGGPGILPDLHPTLFHRLGIRTTPHDPNLGLYLARGLVEAHGGMLVINADADKGSAFRLSLPVAFNDHVDLAGEGLPA